MIYSLDQLSNAELKLYEHIISFDETFEDLTLRFTNDGTFKGYRIIHQQYFELLQSTKDKDVKIETLKRLTFLNWYSQVDPSCFTGLDNLDEKVILSSFSLLNEHISENGLDSEFVWMLSFYSSWDWTILRFTKEKLIALGNFVKSVDNSISSIPVNLLPKGSLDNRGQMGIYWLVYPVEKK